MTKLGTLISEVKIENAGGSEFCGSTINKNDLEHAIIIMEEWGYKPTVYDEVAYMHSSVDDCRV